MEAEHAGFAFRDDPGPTGKVRLLTKDEARKLFPPIYERARLQRNGMMSRSEARWDGRVEDPEHWRDGASPKYYVLIELDGQGEAFAMYRVKSKWERGMSQCELVLVDAIATSTEATRELWRYIFGVDLIAKVILWNYDPATPLFLMVKDARRLQLKLGDGIWLRLVDVGEALRRRSYAGEGSVVLEVTDEFCSVERGPLPRRRGCRADRRRRRAAPVGRRPRLRVPRRVLVRAPGRGRPGGGACRRRDRARHGALQDAAASVVSRALLVAIKVRTCKTLAEFKQAIGAISEYGGWEVDDEIAKRFLRVHPLDHMHAAFDGKRAVGGAGAFPFDLSVPGGSVACAGVTIVGVYPTHRRQGILTSMMRAQLDAAHERGEPIAALWASDERIYGRYGYGLASLIGRDRAAAPARRLRGADRRPRHGSLRRGSRRAEGARADLGARLPRAAGMFARSAEWWKSRIASDPPQWRRGRGPEALRRRRARRLRRGLRDLPP